MSKEDNWCHYSGMPSPKAYEKDDIDYDGMGNQGRVPVLTKNESKLKKLFLNLFKFRKKDVWNIRDSLGNGPGNTSLYVG